MRFTARIGLLLILGTTAASAAHGATRRERTTALIREGERLYQSGQYKQAAETLIKAQALEPDPRLVYNIARAYDQAGELDLALDYYQRYVNSTEGTDPTLLKRSALSIERLRGLLAREEQSQKAREELERQA